MSSAALKVAARSIHIKIHPTARSLPERREVLRVLERFGEVEMFRSLKYDPTNPVSNAFISILSTEEAAQAALEASPIRYRLIADPSPAAPPSPFPSQDTLLLDTDPSASQPSARPPVTESTFELRISASTHPHQQTIASSPLHSTFTPIPAFQSIIASDLSQRIPPSIAKAGLIDWVTDSARAPSSGEYGGRSRDQDDGGHGYDGKTPVQWGRGGGAGGGLAWELKKPWRVKDRERAMREERVPWVMRGLNSRSGAGG